LSVLRKAVVEDMKTIAAMDRVAWKDNRKPDYIPDGEHAWRQWIVTAHVIVAEIQGRIAGCAMAFPCLDSSLCLHKIFVDEEARGCGLGKELLADMLAIARAEGRDIWLTVDPVNTLAVNLYKSVGFEIDVHDESYYGPDEPRYVMIVRRP
jgi:[ribosomal protein S18]-alanine N-acetyltransferase